MAPSAAPPPFPPSTSTSAASEDFNIATSRDTRDVAAKSLQYQQLERALDLTQYMKQVEILLSQPIKIPHSAVYPHPRMQQARQGFFSVRGLWQTEEKRREKISKFFSFGNAKGREWLRDLLLEESDSGEDDDAPYTQRDLKAILKVHKLRRDLQKQAIKDNSQQYNFYGAGMLSAQDPYSDSSRNRPSKQTESSSSSTTNGHPAPILQPLPDDAPEPLSVDANFPNSTVIPLPPLSH